MTSTVKIDPRLQQIDLEQIQGLDREAAENKALDYYETSQVSRASVLKNKISGTIGNFIDEFDVSVTAHDREIVGSCTCENSRKICKHIVAFLYAWLHDGEEFLNVEEKLHEISKMDKDQLLTIVGKIVYSQPELIELFFKHDQQDWDDILDLDIPSE